MNAYEFGLKYFNENFHPSPNCVIFNDKYRPVSGDVNSDEIDVELPFYYEQVLSAEEEKHYERMASPRRLKAEVVEDYLLPNNYITTTSGNTIEGQPDNNFYTIYTYNDQFFVKAGDQAILDEVTISSAKKGITSPKFFGSSDIKLRELINDKSFSLIFFFTDSGSILGSGYGAITDIQPNEIIFFLEKDSLFNPISRFDIKTGSDIKETDPFPYAAIAAIAEFFEVRKITEDSIKKVFDRHFNNTTERVASYLFNLSDSIYDVTGLVLNPIGDFIIGLGTGISTDFKTDPKRWKYYKDDGTVNKNMDPIIPELWFYLEELEEGEKKQEGRRGESVDALIDKIKTRIKTDLNTIKDEEIRKLISKNTAFINLVLDEAKELFKSLSKLASEKNGLIFINAFFIGIYNSLIEAIGGIISIIGYILKFPSFASKLELTDITRTINIGLELLEETIESFLSLFSKENLKKLFNGFVLIGKLLLEYANSPNNLANLQEAFESFIKKAINSVSDGVDYVSVKVDRIGYGIGYIIGFIIEEVLTALATGGAKNVVTALKLTLDSFTSLLSIGSRSTKFVIKNAQDFIKAITLLLRKLKNLDVKKLMDELIAWIKNLIRTSRQLAEEAFERLFKSHSAKQRLRRLGYAPTKVENEIITFCKVN